jgi:hypothetical protein
MTMRKKKRDLKRLERIEIEGYKKFPQTKEECELFESAVAWPDEPFGNGTNRRVQEYNNHMASPVRIKARPASVADTARILGVSSAQTKKLIELVSKHAEKTAPTRMKKSRLRDAKRARKTK